MPPLLQDSTFDCIDRLDLLPRLVSGAVGAVGLRAGGVAGSREREVGRLSLVSLAWERSMRMTLEGGKA